MCIFGLLIFFGMLLLLFVTLIKLSTDFVSISISNYYSRLMANYRRLVNIISSRLRLRHHGFEFFAIAPNQRRNKR